MKRDWDLLRRILFKLEENDDPMKAYANTDFGEIPQHVIGYHTNLLLQAGLIQGECHEVLGPGPDCIATRLTWQGHEFLDAARNKSIWDRVKKVASDKGIDVTFDVLKAMLAHAIKEGITSG